MKLFCGLVDMARDQRLLGSVKYGDTPYSVLDKKRSLGLPEMNLQLHRLSPDRRLVLDSR